MTAPVEASPVGVPVDRAALIDAAADEVPGYYDEGVALDWERRETAEAMLDAVLPLIADAIEACGSRTRDSGEVRGLIPVAAAGRLVRGFLGNQT